MVGVAAAWGVGEGVGSVVQATRTSKSAEKAGDLPFNIDILTNGNIFSKNWKQYTQ